MENKLKQYQIDTTNLEIDTNIDRYKYIEIDTYIKMDIKKMKKYIETNSYIEMDTTVHIDTNL